MYVYIYKTPILYMYICVNYTQSLCEKRAPPLCIQLAGCKSTSKALFFLIPFNCLSGQPCHLGNNIYMFFFLPTLTTNMTHM